MNTKPGKTAEALALLASEPWLSDRAVARQVGLGNKTVSRLRGGARLGRGAPDVGLLSAAELAAATGTSVRQLRRWRERNLLPEPMRHWHGKRQVVLYPHESIEYITTLSELADRYHRLDLAALGLMALGFPVPEQAIRAAYTSAPSLYLSMRLRTTTGGTTLLTDSRAI